MSGHHSKRIDEQDVLLPASHWLARLPAFGAIAALVGALGLIGLGLADPTRALFSYHVSFTYFLTIALGCLFVVMATYASRAGWVVPSRRLFENAMATLPAFVLLLLPLLAGLGLLFHWAHADAVAHDPVLQHKAPYLNATFFVVRALVYVGLWAFLGSWFAKRSIEQDATGDIDITRRAQILSAPGLLLFALTVTFAAFDWLMSLDPHWYSTIFGVYVFAGSTVSAFAFVIVIAVLLRRQGILTDVITAEQYHDLGKMLFAFTVFWAYIAFSQFMLIWYGNIPEETIWFRHRLIHGWQPVSVVLAAGHFVLPFFYLLLRDVKRRPTWLMLAAVWMLIMHYVDVYWLIMPALSTATGVEAHFHPALTDLTGLLFVGGVFFFLLGKAMRRGALVPVKDPRLAEALAFKNF